MTRATIVAEIHRIVTSPSELPLRTSSAKSGSEAFEDAAAASSSADFPPAGAAAAELALTQLESSAAIRAERSCSRHPPLG